MGAGRCVRPVGFVRPHGRFRSVKVVAWCGAREGGAACRAFHGSESSAPIQVTALPGMEVAFRMVPESHGISRFVLSRVAMTAMWIVLLLLSTGCVSDNQNYGTNTVYAKISRQSLNCYLGQIGVEQPNIIASWQDQTCSRIIMIVSASGEDKLVVLHDDSPGFTIRPLDQQTQWVWIDGQGKAQVLPEWSQKLDKLGYATDIDRQSGFFRKTKALHEAREYKVGRVGTDDWLLQGLSTDEFAVYAAAGRTDALFLLDYSPEMTYPFLASRPNCRAYRMNEDGQYTEFDRFRINGRVIAVHPTLPLMLCQGYGGDWFIYDWGMHSKKVIAIWTSDIILLGNYEWLLNRISENSQK